MGKYRENKSDLTFDEMDTDGGSVGDNDVSTYDDIHDITQDTFSKAEEAISPHIKEAANSIVVTSKAKVEIVKSQLTQFHEILTIKLRKKVVESASDLNKMQSTLREGGSFTASDVQSSFPSALPGAALSTFSGFKALGPKALIASAVSGAIIGLGLMRTVSKNSIYIVIGGASLSFVSGKRAEMILKGKMKEHSSFVKAFHVDGTDDIQQESTIRNVCDALGLRYVNQVVRLSRRGQETLAQIMVERIYQALSKQRFNFQDESTFKVSGMAQQLRWRMQHKWDRLTKPADRVRTRRRMHLLERCIRAVVEESTRHDNTALDFEGYFGLMSQPDSLNSSKHQWTANGVLSKTGILVGNEKYVHLLSEPTKYGFCLGTETEAQRRKMIPLHEFLRRQEEFRALKTIKSQSKL